MFDVGFWELVLVALVALLVFGPDRLPGLIRESSLWMRKARMLVSNAKSDIDRELQLYEIKKNLDDKRKRIEKEFVVSVPPLDLEQSKDIHKTDNAVRNGSVNDGK